jgi:serine/threonine protein kinase
MYLCSKHFIHIFNIQYYTGGFGKVMAVTMRDEDKVKAANNKFLAMKVIAKHAVIERKQVGEIFTERDLLVNLRNDFICNAFYAFSDLDNVYLILDLALGGDLSYQLKFNEGGKPFTESRARFYFVQIAAAVAYLHKQSFIHRDIKPANILMDSKGYLKLTDFGISRKLDKNGECRASSGTKAYMAPEVLQSSHKHGKAADWYSVGMTLHEMLFRWPAKLDPKTRQPVVGVPRDERQEGGSLKEEKVKDKGIFRKQKTVEGKLEAKKGMVKKSTKVTATQVSEDCLILLEGLLEIDQEVRIGYEGIAQVRAQLWVKDTSDFIWADIVARTAPAPFLPDTSKVNADMLGEVFEMLAGPAPEPKKRKLSPEEQLSFKNYSYDFTKAKPTRRESRFVSARQRISRQNDCGEIGEDGRPLERARSIHQGIRNVSRKLVEGMSKGRDALIPVNAEWMPEEKRLDGV